MKKVLFIDDQAYLWTARFNQHLAEYGLEVVDEVDPAKALRRIRQEQPDVVLLDNLFQDEDGGAAARGSEVLARIKKAYPGLPVVLITQTLTDPSYRIDEAEFPEADFLFDKARFNPDAKGDPYKELAHQLLSAVKRATERRSLDEQLGFIVGATEPMRQVAEQILRIAGGNSTVLIDGETGTGKELVARAIHELSPRHASPFIAVNCGGLTDEVLESQLFGHEAGAFTGATRLHRGFFEQAEGGSLFLDEVHTMSEALQVKLLRAIQERRIRRMRSEREIAVDVRLIAATNTNLHERVAQGRFREDLYYRLKVIELHLPPLRERLVDLPVLYAHLVNRLNTKLGKNISSELRPDVLERLQACRWPGNIRELEHTLESAMNNARATVLTPSVLRLSEDPTIRSNGALADDLVGRLLEGTASFEALKDIQGETRQRILEEWIAKLTERNGRRPTSAELADLLKTSEDNMRRVLSSAKIRLRALPRSKGPTRALR